MKTMKLLTCLAFISGLGHGLYAQGTLTNCDSLRLRWTDFLTGGHYNPNDPEIKVKLKGIENNLTLYKNSFNRDTLSRKAVWTDLKYNKSTDITASYTRLFSMALAYGSVGTKWYHDRSLKQDILLGLQWLYVNCYNEKTKVPATGGINNWWDYRIGSPEKLNDILCLMYDDILPERRSAYLRTIQHSTPDIGTYTAGNLVWISKIIALSSILANDVQKMDYAVRSLRPVFDYVKAGDGFYTDGSFIQHNKHPYAGGYGVSMISSLAELMYLFPKINVDIPSSTHIYDWIYNAFEPLIYRGGTMSMVMGRGIARSGSTEHSKTRELLEGLLLLAQEAPKNETGKLNAIIKTYIGANQRGISFSTITLTRMANALMNNHSIIAPQNYRAYRQFGNMDRAVQQADDYAFAVSMHSARIYNFESINQENLKGWHLSDGMTYLYNADQAQFEDNFWCTVDYQHLAGTTTEENSTALTNKTSDKTWVGGVSLLDRYGLSGMDLAPFATTLTAKKSWLMLDHQIVCLGAGITNKDHQMVSTTIDQRKLRADNENTLTVDGVIMPSLFAQQRTGIRWAHLSGNVKDADIGYYFPDGIDLHLRRQPQSGRWSDVRTGESGTLNTRYYLTLWKDQGDHAEDNNDTENKYAYVLLPGYTAGQVGKYAKSPAVEILSNTTIVQSARDKKGGLTGANFWKDSTTVVSVDGRPYVTCDKKAAITVLDEAESLTVAVADPTMLNEGLITVEVNNPVAGITEPNDRVVVRQLKPTLKFSVDVRELKGRTITVVFHKK